MGDLISFFLLLVDTEKLFSFVKIIRKKNDNFDLALRKRLFCVAKQPLLPCKTYALGMQNNRFYNTLINKQLHDRYACEKYLQPCCLLFVHKAGYRLKFLLFHYIALQYHEWTTKVFLVCIRKKRTDLKELLFKHWVFYEVSRRDTLPSATWGCW